MFQTRAFIARHLGCEAEDFTITRQPIETYRGREADYRNDSITVRVLVSHPRGYLMRSEGHDDNDLHRRVTATWTGGQAEIRVAPDEEIAW
jgi:hypothetical protein